MGKAAGSNYVAKVPDEDGFIHYTDEENAVWHDLITRQRKVLEGRACQETLDGLDRLGLRDDRIPQPRDVSKILHEATGWQVEPVAALIDFDTFFGLLADRKFPAASFIRTREEMDYLQEPDIFHEIFGHCPLLTFPAFADFTAAYGRAGLRASKQDRVLLARLYWFTVEFGLINRPEEGLRIYGGGITSSFGETQYAVDSDVPERLRFDPVEALRTPYRIDIFQPVYFVLESAKELYELAKEDLIGLIQQARALGEHPPKFPVKEAG